jgi:hypothetical protein
MITLSVSSQAVGKIHTPIATPPLVVSGRPTTITIATYIPDATLIPNSVNLLGESAADQFTIILGSLHDDGLNGDAKAGDGVYSILITLSNTSAVPLRVSAAFRGMLLRQTADVSVPTISVPTIGTASDFNGEAGTLFSNAISARTQFSALAERRFLNTSGALSALTQGQQQLESVFTSLSAIVAFESAQPATGQQIQLAASRFDAGTPRVYPADGLNVLPGGNAVNTIWDLANAGKAAQDSIGLFTADGLNPQVSAIANYCVNTVGLDQSSLTDQSSIGMQIRQQCAIMYEEASPNGLISTIRSSGANFGVESTLEAPTDLIGDGISTLFGLGTLATQAVEGLTGIVIDLFTVPQANASGVLVGTVTNPGNLQVPVGTNTIIYSFGGTDAPVTAANLFVLQTADIPITFIPDQNQNFSGEPSTWTETFPVNSPSARAGHGLAYDTLHNQVVLFGGEGAGAVYSSETWVWDGANWTQKFPTKSPSARAWQAMAFDFTHNQVVLFGGQNGAGNLNDTWVWDGATWTQKFPVTQPVARAGSAMAYDALRKQTVLFGGVAFSFPGVFNDTWTWDGATWTQKFPTKSPSVRSSHAMAFDAGRSQILLFGGLIDKSASATNDTWVWDGATWTQKSPVSNPPARYDHAMAYDVGTAQTVMFGGYKTGLGSGPWNDTWTWDGANWTQKFPFNSPVARCCHTMAYDTSNNQVLLFGGGYLAIFNDTWVWKP